MLGAILRKIFGRDTRPWSIESINYLEVKDLCFSSGIVSYKFRMTLSGVVEVLSFNKGLKPELEGRWKYRKSVEKGLGWATLVTARPKQEVGEIVGRVSGRVEDFTLSAYGTRGSRAILKDETIWHAIPGDNLVQWGFRGRIKEYTVNYKAGCHGLLAAPGSRQGYEYAGRAEHRAPGLSVIIGKFNVVSLESTELFSRSRLGRGEASKIVQAVDEASEIFISRGLLKHGFTRIVEIWSETDPFAQDNMLALRSDVVKGFLKGRGEAIYELLGVIGAVVMMEIPPARLDAYWGYESLPEALAMAVAVEVGGDVMRALNDRIAQLSNCVAEYARGGIPVYGSGIPKGVKQRVAIRCAAPLAFWRLIESGGPDSLWSFIECLRSRAGTGYGEEDLEYCISEADSEISNRVFREGNVLA